MNALIRFFNNRDVATIGKDEQVHLHYCDSVESEGVVQDGKDIIVQICNEPDVLLGCDGEDPTQEKESAVTSASSANKVDAFDDDEDEETRSQRRERKKVHLPAAAAMVMERLPFLAPTNPTVWSARKQELMGLFDDALPSSSSSCSSSLPEDPYQEDPTRSHFERVTRRCELELFLLSVVLSKFPKVGEVWTHRLWVISQQARWMHRHHRVIPCGARDCVGEEEEDSKRGGSSHIINWSRERTLLHRACDAHFMNLLAWEYRRQLCRLQQHLSSSSCFSSSCIALQQVQIEEVDDVIAFVRCHQSDASSTSYLLFLLDQTLSSQQREVQGGRMCDGNSHVLLVRMLCLSTWLLTQSWNIGHEGLWMFRLGLMHRILFGVPNSIRGSSGGGEGRGGGCIGWLPGNWTVADELEFVLAHCEGPAVQRNEVHDEAEEEHTPQVFRATSVAAAAVESNGSVSWHRYYAASYGAQLCALLASERDASGCPEQMM